MEGQPKKQKANKGEGKPEKEKEESPAVKKEKRKREAKDVRKKVSPKKRGSSSSSSSSIKKEEGGGVVDLSGSTDTTALTPVDAKAAIKAAYQKSFQVKRELEGEENADSAESKQEGQVEEAPSRSRPDHCLFIGAALRVRGRLKVICNNVIVLDNTRHE